MEDITLQIHSLSSLPEEASGNEVPDADADEDFLPSDNSVFTFAGEGDHVLSLSSLLAPNYYPPLEGMSKFCLRFCFFEAASYYVNLSCYILLDSTWTSWSDVCKDKNVFLIIGSHTVFTKGSATFTEALFINIEYCFWQKCTNIIVLYCCQYLGYGRWRNINII